MIGGKSRADSGGVECSTQDISQRSSKACKPSVSFIRLYCDYKLPESFDNVVACDGCDKCVNFTSHHIGDWFCNHCRYM